MFNLDVGEAVNICSSVFLLNVPFLQILLGLPHRPDLPVTRSHGTAHFWVVCEGCKIQGESSRIWGAHKTRIKSHNLIELQAALHEKGCPATEFGQGRTGLLEKRG